MDRDVNVLAFGLPGTGKTHAMCAIGHRLVQSGRSVLFIPAYRLVQDMLAAKRDLDLPRMLRKLDNYDLLVIDDLGYLPQGAEESEVLFTLIAERYERRSLGITSNLVFSEWGEGVRQPDCDSCRVPSARLRIRRQRPAADHSPAGRCSCAGVLQLPLPVRRSRRTSSLCRSSEAMSSGPVPAKVIPVARQQIPAHPRPTVAQLSRTGNCAGRSPAWMEP